MSLSPKWPRGLEGHPRLAELEALLGHAPRPLWSEGTEPVPHVAATEEFERMFVTLAGRQQVARGLEHIQSTLAAEHKGLEALRAKQGGAPSQRVSRLLIIADGGSERFYRNCESVLQQHGDRLLGLRLENGAALIEKLYGSDATAKVLLLSHRDAVAKALVALLPPNSDS